MPPPEPSPALRWWRVRFETVVLRTSPQNYPGRRWRFVRHERPGYRTALRLRSARGRELDFKLHGGAFVRRVRLGR